MAILVKCGQCGKDYRLDDKLAGRRVKCKQCQSPIGVPGTTMTIPATPKPKSIPQADPFATPHEDDLLSNLRFAASAEESLAPTPAPQPTTVKAQKECPACATSMAPNAIICTSCGYNLQTRAYMQTEYEAAPAPAAAPRAPSYIPSYGSSTSSSQTHDRQGFRNNVSHSNHGIDLIDRLLVNVGYWLFIISLFIQGIGGLFSATHTPSPATACTMFIIGFGMMLAFLFLILIPLTLKGLEIAGGLLKFRFPDDLFQRLIASWFYSSLAWIAIIVIATIGAMAATAASGGKSYSGIGAFLSIGLIFFGIFFHIFMQFITSWFFFRLKFLEAIVTTIFLIISQFVAFLVMMGLSMLLVYILGRIIGVPAHT